MSRVIKFRAWFDGPKLMGNVVELKGSNRTNYDANMWGEAIAEVWINGRQQFYSGYNFKLLEFTGLLDKNGKEIFEGDVIEAIDSNGERVRHKVSFFDAGFTVFNLNFFNESKIDNKWVHEFGFRVIGNIYESPELLATSNHHQP